MPYVEFILETLQSCVPIAERHFGRAAASTKPGDRTQVVTEADVAIGRTIAGAVEAAFPTHNVIDEEIGIIDRGSRFTWVVDPIDGTSNFVSGVPMYGIMIGLLDGGQPLASGISLPAFRETYWAERGHGTWCNGNRIAVRPDADIASSLVAYGLDGHAGDRARTRAECLELVEIVMAARNVRCSNSVFDAMMVAHGKYGGWVLRTSRIWDNVAPHLIIEEAGGKYTRLYGVPARYDAPLTLASENFDACAASPLLHDQLQELLRSSSV